MKFSAVIVTYNRLEYVLQAIESVVQQTHAAHEIIVIVDGSTDGTEKKVASLYPDVRLSVQPNLGASIAHNTGVAIATGDWVCFLDDDDLWHREKLARTAAFLQDHPDCRALRNPVWYFADSETGPDTGFGFKRDLVASSLAECHASASSQSPNSFEHLLIHGQSLDRLLERNLGVMSSSVVHRETLIRAGCFCPMQSCGDDWTMFVNVARLSEWHTIPERLGFTRLHPRQNTHDYSNGLHALIGLCNAWLTGRPKAGKMDFSQVIELLATYGHQYRATVQHCFWGALLQGKFTLARAILAAGQILLPNFIDRLYLYLPPQLTWRWERYILRMHK